MKILKYVDIILSDNSHPLFAQRVSYDCGQPNIHSSSDLL